MWTVVYTAQSRDIFENMCNALRNSRILLKTVEVGSHNKFDILVPSAEVEQAHNVLIDMTF